VIEVEEEKDASAEVQILICRCRYTVNRQEELIYGSVGKPGAIWEQGMTVYTLEA